MDLNMFYGLTIEPHLCSHMTQLWYLSLCSWLDLIHATLDNLVWAKTEDTGKRPHSVY